jgi:hypothetical protein
MKNPSDIAVSLAFLLPPCAAIVWAWWNRAVPARTLREKMCVWGLATLTADVLYCGVFLLWPYFGATLGSGVHHWERTLTLVVYGFWLSALALLMAVAANPGRTRRLLLLLSIAGLAFWFVMQIPVSDFLAVEHARQAASQMRP